MDSLFFRPTRLQHLKNIIQRYQTVQDVQLKNVAKDFYKGPASKETLANLKTFIDENFVKLTTQTVVAMSPVGALAYLMKNCAALQGIAYKNSRGGYPVPKLEAMIEAIFQRQPTTEAVDIMRTLLQKRDINNFVAVEGTEEEAKLLLGQALRLSPPFWKEIKPKVYNKKAKGKRGRKPKLQQQISASSSSSSASGGAQVVVVGEQDEAQTINTVGETQHLPPAITTVALVHHGVDGSSSLGSPRRQIKKRVVAKADFDEITVIESQQFPPSATSPPPSSTPPPAAPPAELPPAANTPPSVPSPPSSPTPAPHTPQPPPREIEIGDLVWAKERFRSYWLGRVVNIAARTRHMLYTVDMFDRYVINVRADVVKPFNRQEPLPPFVKLQRRMREQLPLYKF